MRIFEVARQISFREFKIPRKNIFPEWDEMLVAPPTHAQGFDDAPHHHPTLIIMAESFASECTPLKQKYDNCFNDWYANKCAPARTLPVNSRFLKGEGSKGGCVELFTEYRSCVEVCSPFALCEN